MNLNDILYVLQQRMLDYVEDSREATGDHYEQLIRVAKELSDLVCIFNNEKATEALVSMYKDLEFIRKKKAERFNDSIQHEVI